MTKSFNNIRLVMFDLDGTLIDTAIEIATAANRTLTRHDLPNLPAEQIKQWIGKGTDWFCQQVLQAAMTQKYPGSSPKLSLEAAQSKQVFQDFLSDYADCTGHLGQPFPGVLEGLQLLSQHHIDLAIVSNKERALVEILLRRFNMTDLFSMWVCGNDLPKLKPHPMPLLHCMAQRGQTPEHSLFVGDSSNDVLAARHAHVPVWAMSYGYNHNEPIAQTHPDRICDHFSEVVTPLISNRALPPC